MSLFPCRDAIIITVADALTAVYIGFAFFAVMGHVAYLRGVTVDAFQSSGAKNLCRIYRHY